MKTTFQMSCPLKEILRKAIKRTFVVSFIIIYFFMHEADFRFRACLHGGGGPQVGEVTRLGEVKK